MKIVVDVPEPLISQIKRAVESGGYEDARDFVTTAMENQVELEESGSEDLQTLDDAITSPESPGVKGSRGPASEGEEFETDELGRREYDVVPTVSKPDENRLPEGPLWGQYNRLFPVKLVVRRLANVIEEENTDLASPNDSVEWVDLADFREATALVARDYGFLIKEHDERRSRGRGEKLAAGLPTGENEEKSVDRFETHFVGKSKQGGNLDGAAPRLSFVNITDHDVGQIGITEAGLEFAELHNPLLDEGVNADRPLSSEECKFYLDHVSEELSDEFDATVTVIEAIEDGVERPDALTERVAEIDDDWSESQATTVRSGLVSRLHELGLLTRERVGQRGVAYRVTEEGKGFLDNRNLSGET